jgi:hypothetical protein
MKPRVAICVSTGMILTVLPLLLLAAMPVGTTQNGVAERILSVLAGPGVLVSRPLFGVHNLGFFVVTPLVNFVFWSAVTYTVLRCYARMWRTTR